MCEVDPRTEMTVDPWHRYSNEAERANYYTYDEVEKNLDLHGLVKIFKLCTGSEQPSFQGINISPPWGKKVLNCHYKVAV